MPKGLAPDSRNAIRHQVAALPVRERDGRTEVCLITTRTTSRWTVPKGWPMKGHKDHFTARIEAEEEAGVTGKPGKKPIGSFVYWKHLVDHFDLVKVTVYPLRVTGSLPTWKEQAERRVHWMSLEDASIIVNEPSLAALLSKFGDKARSIRPRS
jgi:8-oxo-dGTP pyrophosphatase MutT (NUDIX family)